MLAEAQLPERESPAPAPEGTGAAGPRGATEDLGEDSGPVRRCLASGERLPKEALLRFVLDPEGGLVPDLAERLPGRGLWIRPRRALVEKAVKRRLFARAAKTPVGVPADLPGRLATLLRRRCLEGIGLAKRAGALAVGHDQVRAVLTGGRAVLLIQARDGSDSERERVAALGRGRCPELAICRLLDSAELGEALGRATAVHLAVTDARMAGRLQRDLQRLAEYEMPEDTVSPGAAPPGGLDRTGEAAAPSGASGPSVE